MPHSSRHRVGRGKVTAGAATVGAVTAGVAELDAVAAGDDIASAAIGWCQGCPQTAAVGPAIACAATSRVISYHDGCVRQQSASPSTLCRAPRDNPGAVRVAARGQHDRSPKRTSGAGTGEPDTVSRPEPTPAWCSLRVWKGLLRASAARADAQTEVSRQRISRR